MVMVIPANPFVSWGQLGEGKDVKAAGTDVPFIASSGAANAEIGQATVEFALVGVVFFLIVVGVLEFGLTVSYQASLAHAAREGARAGMYGSYPCSDYDANTQIRDSINSQLGTLRADRGNVTTTIANTGSGSTSKVRITLSYTHHAITPMIAVFAPSGIPLSASAESVVYTYQGIVCP
jgi:Flp pilus assembly protein TadG